MDQPSKTNRTETPVIESNSLNVGEVVETAKDNEVVNLPSSAERLNNANGAVAQATSSLQVQLPANLSVTQQTTTQPIITAIVADDVDVIEKEWVQKAKKIVADTLNDPHRRSDEFTYTKHDYVKTRFGKDTKLPDKQVA